MKEWSLVRKSQMKMMKGWGATIIKALGPFLNGLKVPGTISYHLA